MEEKRTTKRYPPELKERAVKMVSPITGSSPELITEIPHV